MANSISEEINLLDLLARFLTILKKKLLLSILFPIAGTTAGLLISYFSGDRYESTLLVETSLLSENECNFLFGQLNKVGSIPGLTVEEKEALVDMSFKVYRNGSDDELNEKSLFIELTARVSNKEVFPSLQKAWLNVINQHPSVSRHRHEREKYYDQMISKIDEEIQSMETVKKEISGNIQATYLNPAELYARSVLLQKERIQYEIRREQVKVVHLINGFDSLSVELKPSRLLPAAVGFAVGFLLLCVFLLVKFFVQYFTIYETTH